MSRNKLQENFVYKITRSIFAVPEVKTPPTLDPKKILIVRQHNQLGDMLAGVPLFRALKEKYPDCQLTLIAGPQNYYGVEKNKYIDNLFVFDKKQLINPLYLYKVYSALKNNYDIVIVPVTVSVSFTSNIISRLSDAKFRVGPASLDGVQNKSSFLFHYRQDIDWRNYPDSNVAERILDIISFLKITPSSFKSEITFDNEDIRTAQDFIGTLSRKEGELLIGLHPGAGKPQNRWSLLKFISLIDYLNSSYSAKFYLTGGHMDKEEIEYMRKHLHVNAGYFLDHKIPEIAALISMSDLFITNDTGIMHVAGTTNTPQLSIFGPTNPYNWAPVGENKLFIRKSDLIDDIETEDIIDLCRIILKSSRKVNLV